MGIQSNDIDFAIDNMTGDLFALEIQKYMENKKTNQEIKIHNIKSNPDKSKHLETVKCYIKN